VVTSRIDSEEPHLYPPTVTPPVQLGRFEQIIKFIRNPAAALPLAVYERRIVRDRFRPDHYIWTADPEYIAHILLHGGDTFAKTPIDRRIFGPAIGNGILTSEGATWRWHRKAAAPLFRHGELLQYVPAMSQAARRAAASWQEACKSERVVAIEHDMTLVTFDVISNTILSGCGAADSALIKKAGEDYLDPISWEISYALMGIPRWVPFPGRRRMLSGAQSLRDAVGRLVQSRRSMPDPGADILGRLIAARHPDSGDAMNDEEIIDNLATFLLAGHETTARALTWTLYLLARAPSWQQSVRDEVKRVAGDEPLTADHIEHLKITERVLKEAMRLYPPAPVVSRQATVTTKLGSETIEKGAIVILPIFALHRHRSLWDDPDRFDPNRFTPEREQAMPRAQYMPFGFGPRVCIGAAFAMLEAKILLAEFIRAAAFDWDGHHLPEPVARVTLRPAGGMPLLVKAI
jgi:cytochrome P450